MTAGAVCLGVTRSAAGKTWRYRLEDDTRVNDLARRHSFPDLLARILAARSFDEAKADSHFDATLRAWMPDPSSLADLDLAAARIADAIVSGERCAVFGDYDVDGGASSALLLRYFRALGRDLRLYIPDRMTEGYGPNAAAFRQLAGEGVRLVITVDCGAQAFDALTAAQELGLAIVVADHHLMEERLPPAFAIVNPNRPDDTSGLGHLCAAGVTFMLLAGLNRELRRRGWFDASAKEPDLREFVDLVALATICDVVPLTGLNRAFVNQGLKRMQRRGGAGLEALRAIAGVKGQLRASHFGFALGPRVNAGGRVGRSDLGALLLASDDRSFATRAAIELDRYNRERQAIEAEVLERATAQLRATGVGAGLAAAHGEGWHPGVIGIVAGRIKDRFDLPAAVFALDETTAKASLRSIAGVDIGEAVAAARAEGLLTSGGGHRMAAALSAPREHLADIIAFLEERLAPQVATRDDRGLYAIDAVAGPAAFTPELHDLVERAGPYGAGNPEPAFAVADARIVDVRIAGENHVSIVAQCGDARLRGIAFRSANNEIGKALTQKGRPVHLAGRLLLNEWDNQKRVELSIEDAAPVGSP